MRKITGVIFSDLGQASSFMKLDWVQRALAKSLGFAAFPATLNVRPKTPEDAQVWQNVQNESNEIALRMMGFVAPGSIELKFTDLGIPVNARSTERFCFPM